MKRQEENQDLAKRKNNNASIGIPTLQAFFQSNQQAGDAAANKDHAFADDVKHDVHDDTATENTENLVNSKEIGLPIPDENRNNDDDVEFSETVECNLDDEPLEVAANLDIQEEEDGLDNEGKLNLTLMPLMLLQMSQSKNQVFNKNSYGLFMRG